MIAVIWSDLVAWQAKWSKRTLCLAIVGLAITGGFTMLRPELCAESAAIAAILVGLFAGKQSWSEVQSWEWVRRAGLKPGRVVTAKLAAALCIAGAHLLVMLPAGLLAAPLWGINWPTLGRVALIAMSASLTAASLGLIGSHCHIEDDEYLGNYLVVIWLVFTAALKPLRPVNPLLQIWAAMPPRDQAQPFGLLWSVAIAAGLAVVAGMILRREVIKER